MKKMLFGLVVVGLFGILSGCNTGMYSEVGEIVPEQITYYISIRFADDRGNVRVPLNNGIVRIEIAGEEPQNSYPNDGGWVACITPVEKNDLVRITVLEFNTQS